MPSEKQEEEEVNGDCVCKFFFAFFQSPLVFTTWLIRKDQQQDFLFLGPREKKKKEKEKRFWNLHFYNIQSHNTHTQNVYRAIRIYDCGKCSIFRVAIFILLARFNVRIFVRRGVRAADRFWRENFVFSIISSR